MNKEMLISTVTISWCPQDIINEYGVSEEGAIFILNDIAEILEDRSIELGWEIIRSLVDTNNYLSLVDTNNHLNKEV